MLQLALRTCLLLACALFSSVNANAAQRTAGSADTAAAANFQGDIYILKGGYGVFSTGLSKLGAQLRQNGVNASLVSYQTWRSVTQKIVDHHRQYGRKPVVIIGHSLGANNAILIANALKTKGIKVDLIVSYASTGQMKVPSNVRNVLNYYFKSGGWGGIFIPESDFSGNLDNRDMSKHPGMSHFNVDDSPVLRDEVVRNVLRHVRPAKSAMAGQ